MDRAHRQRDAVNGAGGHGSLYTSLFLCKWKRRLRSQEGPGRGPELTRLAAAGDAAQQLADFVVRPLVQNSGKDVQVCLREVVLEKVTWRDNKTSGVRQGRRAGSCPCWTPGVCRSPELLEQKAHSACGGRTVS